MRSRLIVTITFFAVVGLVGCAIKAPSAVSSNVSRRQSSAPFTPWRSLPSPVLQWNGAVQGMFQKYLRHNRTDIEGALDRLSEYLPEIQPIFERYALPPELLYLGIVESWFQPKAKSYAGASGIWQIMKPLASDYGLSVGLFRDERKDPIKSTEAAARFLLDLYREFDDWYLALAAYNAGRYKISQLLKETGVTDFWSLCKTGKLRTETEQFVPKFIAMALILKEGARYGFNSPLDESISK